MERSESRLKANAVGRYREIDAEVRTSGFILSVVVALSSLAFWSSEPWLIPVAWSSLLFRAPRLFIRTDLGLYRWAVAATFAGGASIILGASVTGGLSSPGMHFVMLIGVVASMSFAHQPLWGLFPVALTVMIGVVDVAVEGVERVDYLMASAVVIVSLAIPRLVSDMVGVELKYRQKAVVDPLTGCLNRSSMDIRMNELQHQAAQSGDDIGVIAIDIDHFKTINDQFGHGVGDEVLQQVAYAIRRNLRRFELLYRTGGEEFVLLLPGANLGVSHTLAEKIRVAVENEVLSVGQVTISLGVAAERAPIDLEALVDLADQNLLDAKKTGRNRTVSASSADSRGLR